MRTNISKRWKATTPISVNLPNGTKITNKYETHLPLPHLPKTACLARIFNELSSVSLISIGQLCNAGCQATFDKNSVTITLNDTTILKGHRNHFNQLWEVNLDTIHSTPINTTHENKNNVLNNIYRLSSKPSIITYLHAACGYPVKSTWLQAIKKGFFPLMALSNLRTCQQTSIQLNHNLKSSSTSNSKKPTKHKNTNTISSQSETIQHIDTQ